MHRFWYRTVQAATKSSVSIRVSCVPLAKCGKAYRLETGVGVRALSTSSVKICEKKNDVMSSNKDDKPTANSDADTTETPALIVQTTEDDNKVVNTVTQTEQPAVLMTNDKNTMQQHMDVKIKSTVDKKGKENLLKILGSMKVEVTSKRQNKQFKMNQSSKSTNFPKLEAMESTANMFQQATQGAASKSETLGPELLAAASAAASTLPNRSQAEYELIKQLRKHETASETQKVPMDLRAIIADMKVSQNLKHSDQHGIWHQVEEEIQGDTLNRKKTAARRKTLLSGKRLGIFSPTPEEKAVSTVARPTLWDVHYAEQLSLVINHTHLNELQEMIQWTKEGKMWQYPINNEAGLDEEAGVSFDEHIFLERHLEEGFPRDGPVRHFMELVVAGLSRNPYLTVQNKKEHISWYREYFKQNEEALQ